MSIVLVGVNHKTDICGADMAALLPAFNLSIQRRLAWT
jgi:hypothetical protein